jgi:hypothetical protein
MTILQAPEGSIWYNDANTSIGQSPYIDIKQTASGHFVLFDDTPDVEAIQMQHGPTGTYWRVNPDGSKEQIIHGNNFTVVINDNNLVVQGVCNIEVHGDSKLHVYGDMHTQIDGNLNALVLGNPSTSPVTAAIHVAGDVDLTADGDVSISAGSSTNLDPLNPSGAIILNTQAGVIINGDVTVNGKIMSLGSISAGGPLNPFANITAGGKVIGQYGLETLFGGVNVGFTSELTGPEAASEYGIVKAMTSFLTPGLVAAGVSVTAPIIAGVVTSDIQGPMALLRLFGSLHNHIAPNGPTSTSPEAGIEFA